MDNEMLIEILSSWNFWEREHETGVQRRGYLERLEKLVGTEQVVAVTGVRRSGKSTLMKQFIKKRMESGERKENFLYVNLEEPRFAGMTSLELLQQIFDAYMEIVKPDDRPYILLDEIQNVPRWESLVRSIHEKKEAHVLISGSSSRLLSREFGTLLTGRWVEMKVYPLGFQEFLRFRGMDIKSKTDILSHRTKIRQLLREYLEFGGFPLVALKQEKQEILKRYLDDVVGRDVAERYKIRSISKLKALARHYLTSFSSPVSYRRTARLVGLSLDSTERFSSYLSDAYLIFLVPRFSYSLREQEINPRKVYGIDAGLVNLVGLRFSDNIGRLFENAVFLALLQMGGEIYYYKNKGECDFILKEGQDVTQAIQVSYHVGQNKEREIKGLSDAMDTLGLKSGLVITDNEEGEEKIGSKTIRYAPLWKWLLDI